VTEWSDGRDRVQARVLADSISPEGNRLTTFEVTHHRFVLAEFNTHRMLSRNSASSRAVPIEKQVERVMERPAMPVEFGSNQRGMQAGAPLEGHELWAARQTWLRARDEAVTAAQTMINLGVHKQVANRVLEPFMWNTAIISATDWEGFWHQRCSPLAQPEIRVAAEAMREAYLHSDPTLLQPGEWHTPLIQPDEDYDVLARTAGKPENKDPVGLRKRVSAARCARVSYLTHDGERDITADLALYDRLVTADPMHACYDDQTEILTDRGFRPLSEITTADVVGVWDAEAGTLRYEQPRAIHSYDYDGPMHRIEHPKVDLLVTPNHRMWVSQRSNHGAGGIVWKTPRVVEARHLGDKSMVRYHKAAPLIDAPDVKMDHLPYADDHDALLTLVGFFLGDGHAARHADYNPNRITFHLRVPRKIIFLRHLADRLGWPLLEQAGGTYAFAVEDVGRKFRSSFYDDEDRKILAGTFNQKQSLAILDGLRNSDGSVKRKTWVYDTTSEPLRDAIEQLLLHAGLSWSRAGDGVYEHGRFRLSIHTVTDPVVNQGRRNTSVEHYTGKVWCPTVSTGLVVVRRNGQVVICGNSPLEHVATPFRQKRDGRGRRGNFTGWTQHRHEVSDT